jgi:hypothetical protein
MKRLALVVGSVLLTLVTSSLPARALAVTEHPVSGSFTVDTVKLVFFTDPSCPSGELFEMTGTGDITPFGAASLSLHICDLRRAGGALQSSFTLTADDGTVSGVVQSYLISAGAPPQVATFHFDLSVGAGTGAFAGATGAIALDGALTIPPLPPSAGTASGSVAYALPLPTPPTVAGPVTGGNGSPAALTTAFDLGLVGSEQTEFFLSGRAQAYAPTSPLASDGHWSVAPVSDAPYTTRLIVHRPIDRRRFNGTVVVEWLNVSIGSDVGVDWGFAHNELIRRGFAWVGVSAQAVGLNAAKSADPVRYGPLSHPGDSYSYDMFSQAGQAIRSQAATLLGGLRPQRLIASGESQSAGRMVTYIDAIQPLAHAYDGFLVHSRGAGGAPLSQSPLPSVPTPSTAMIRADNTTPVLVLQSETDVNEGARQDDSPTFRLWEMAGTAHVDAYTVGIGLGDVGDGRGDTAMFNAMRNPPGIGCGAPVNTGPSHVLVQSAMRRLHQWIRRGIQPPRAPRLEVTSFSPTTYARDANGNVLGGIRTPHVDAPVATITNAGQSGPGLLCRLVGATFPFDAQKLAALYRSHDNFVTQWRKASRRAVDAGFLLAVDARLLNAAATQSTIPG